MPEKSAEEWVREHFPNRSDTYRSFFIDAYRKIQRNAKHAAMLEAAEIGYRETTNGMNPCARSIGSEITYKTASAFKQSILTAAKKYED